MKYTREIAEINSEDNIHRYNDLDIPHVWMAYYHYWSLSDITTLRGKNFNIERYSDTLQIGYLHSIDLVDLVNNI